MIDERHTARKRRLILLERRNEKQIKKKTTTKLLTNKIGRIIKAIAKQDTNIIQQQKTKNINTKNVFEIHLNHLRETVTFNKKNKKQNTKQK